MKRLLRFLQMMALILIWNFTYAQVPPYCLPAYSVGCTWGDGLKHFQLGSIDQPITCTGTPAYYHDFTAVSTSIEQGETITLTVIPSYSNVYVDVWIDFDDNGTFDSDELVVDDFLCSTSNTPYSTDMTIPSDAPVGQHTLRFRTNWNSPVQNPCFQYNYGNAADFTVNIPNNIPPVDIITFDDNSQGQVLNSAQLCYINFRMPNCVDYDLSELGANINALSYAGHIKFAIYEGTTLKYTSDEVAVTGGVAEYVSVSVPSGSFTLNGNTSYKVALMADPTSPARIYFDAGVNIVNNGVATEVTSSSSLRIYSGLTYPTFPEPLYYDGASYGTVSAVIRGYVASSGNTAGTDVQTACDSFTWIDGNTYTASNNTATFTVTNAAGCDSLVSLDLTMGYSNTGIDLQTACDSYTWIDGNTYTASNNTATFTLPNAVGCDSIVTLNLTLNNSVTITPEVYACDSAEINSTWYYSSQQITENYPGGAVNGCDSTVITTLTIENMAIAGNLTKVPDVTEVCENEFVGANLTAGTGGTGTDELMYRTNDGAWGNWLPYTDGNAISTVGLSAVEIRTRRLGDYCDASDYALVSWTVSPLPVNGSLAKSPDVMDVCENDNVSAAFSPGEGGNGIDELEYRLNDGVWGNWLTYTSGSELSTSGLSAIEIRTRRLSDLCTSNEYVTVSWNVEPTPVTGSLAKIPDVMDICGGEFVAAVLTPGTGGNGVDELEYRLYDGVWGNWLSYTSGINISTAGVYMAEIRTRRMSDHCTPDVYATVSWNIEAITAPGILNKIPDDDFICENNYVSAELIPGTGGNGIDELEYRRYNQSWSAWQPYTSGQDIPTTYQTAVEIRTRRMADYCTISDYATVSWIIQPKPMSFAGPNDLMCASDTYTLSNATASNYSSLVWTTDGDGYFDDPSILNATYHPGNGDINYGAVSLYLRANAIAPCDNFISDMVIIDIQKLPNANAGSNATICALDSYQLSSATANHYSSLLWSTSGSGSFDDATALHPTYTPSAADITDGFVNLTLTAGSLAPCDTPDSDMMILTINPLQEVSVSITADQTTVCDGTLVSFTAQTTNAGDNPSYQWMVNGATLGSNSSFSYAPANGDQVQLQLTSSLYCVGDATALSNTISLSVNPIPEVSVSITANQTEVCAGTSISFTAEAVNGGSSPAYQWYVNGNTAGSNSSSFSYAPANDDQVWVQLTSNIGCNEGATALSNSIQLQVNPTLEATVSIATNNTSLCSGSSASFSSTIENGGDNPQYQWTVNGNPVGSNSASFSYVPMNLDVVQLTLTSNAICVENSTVSSNSITMHVTQSIEASAFITVDDATVCEGELAHFTANTANGGAAPVYVWFVNNQSQGNSQPTYSYVPQDGDEVHMKLFSSEQCVSNNPVTSNSIDMAVGEIPTVSWDNFEPSTMCIFWAPVALTGGEPAGGTYSGDGVENNMFYPELAGAGEHELTYTYSTSFGCTEQAQFTVFVDVCTGLAEQNALTNVNLYPNPTRHQLHVSFGQTRVSIKQMMVVNMLGEVAKVYTTPEAKSYYTLDVTDLKQGTYLLRIITDSGVENKAFIVRE